MEQIRNITADMAQKDFVALLDGVTRNRKPIKIISDNNESAVLLSTDDWNEIQETLYFHSIPGMVDSIKSAAAEPLSNGVPACEVDFDV